MKYLKIFLTSAFMLAAFSVNSVTFYADNGPFFYQNFGDGGICIGGDICGESERLTITYPSVYITSLEVNADDNIGDKHRAELELYVDGVPFKKLDVKKDGSTLIFDLNRNVKSLRLMSVSKDEHKSDETRIYTIYSY